MREKLPENFLRFKKAHPDIYEAFEELGRLLHETGTLSERERRLVKLGIAIGLGTEGGVHSAVRFALAGSCSKEDVSHAVRLAITTIGWPRALAAMSWVEDRREGKRTSARFTRPDSRSRSRAARRPGRAADPGSRARA
jgi:alkylhydroperoxidase/carboxymuconolactone decarboxylase family protein YurZ